jgi:hypothetical protein
VIEVFHKANTYVDESIRFDRENNQWLCCVSAYIAPFDSWITAEIEAPPRAPQSAGDLGRSLGRVANF